MKKIAVVGGGPAGMMAAYRAAASGCQVTLLEHNEKLGKKLFITGKGRCNVTNACDMADFFENIPVNGKFLYAALYTFTNDALVGLLNEGGLKTKVERGGRVFPASDKSSDVIQCLKKLLDREKVRVRLGAQVQDVLIEGGQARGVTLSSGERLFFDRVILATGGKSYPKTGSTGDGYGFAKRAGHTISKIRPSLVPLTVKELAIVQAMQGLSLKNVQFSLKSGHKILFRDFGEMLFTHFGLSGPLVLSASAHIGDFSGLTGEIDWKPALSEKQLDARLVRDFAQGQNKRLKNLLPGLLPAKAVGPMLQQAGLDGEAQANGVTKAQREALISALKGFSLHIAGARSIDEAIVTRGGVSVREINPSTMESRLVKNLFFAGELIDVDAYTGGFNLQIAFSTGYLAGLSAGTLDG